MDIECRKASRIFRLLGLRGWFEVFDGLPNRSRAVRQIRRREFRGLAVQHEELAAGDEVGQWCRLGESRSRRKRDEEGREGRIHRPNITAAPFRVTGN